LGREIIFKEILIQKYVVREKNLYELIKETNDIKNITKFKAIHLKYLYKGVDDYIKNLLESKIYSDDDRVIMKIVLNKFSE